MVHGASCLSKLLQDRYLAELMTLKTRMNFKEQMKRGASLLALGPAGVKGGFERKFMLLAGIYEGGQSTRERERVHPCNLCDKVFKSV